MRSSYPVLIVGAGPTGMVLAAELQHYGIDFLIVDKRSDHVSTSNAAGIHARTLECWQKRPWQQKFLAEGLKIKGASINAKQKRLATFNFSYLQDTQYPFILSIPQNQTEEILDQHLTTMNTPVTRNTTLTNLTSKENCVVAQLSTPEGTREITADWVIGCDGYHSAVRNCMNIEFAGEDLEDKFLLVDADFTADYESDLFHVYVVPEGILAFFMMKNSTRIIASIGHDSRFKDVTEPTTEIISEIIKQRTNLNFKITNIRWKSHFWIHERIATQLRKERVFLAGDAAHVHSPAGGQGMNTGIQDAYNLAWKLAYVIKGHAPASLLESYQPERHRIAKSVVDMTSKMTVMASIQSSWLTALRNFFMPFLAKKEFFCKEMVGRMSELALHYLPSKIIVGKKIGDLVPGHRAPDVLLDNQYLLDKLAETQHNLLVFHASDIDKKQLNLLKNKYSNVLTILFFDKPNPVYQFATFSLCLIRPDGYISYLGDNKYDFEKYLEQYLLS